MPIRAEYKQGDLEAEAPDIMPGEASVLPFEIKQPYTLVVNCNANDRGGMVYRIEGSEEIRSRAQLSIMQLQGKLKPEAAIGNGEQYTRRAKIRGKLGTLTLTHYPEEI